jgi:DNA-binding NarL/FixJ family response regulator
MSIRVLLVDDQPSFRANLRALLELESDIQVVGEAESGERALEHAASLLPDVTLMDLGMPGMGGLEATRALARRGNRVLVVSCRPEEEALLSALEAGSQGYVSKTRADRDVPPALRAVAGGSRFLGTAARRVLRAAGEIA